MTIDKTRALVVSAIWKAMGKSGIDLTGLPQVQQEEFVGKLADELLVTVDDLLEEARVEGGPDPGTKTDAGEQVLWEGRPFLSLVESYTLTSERIKVTRGLFGRLVENFELVRVQDIDINQGMTERMMGVGDLTIRGADESDPILTLRNVRHPEDVYEKLRRAWLEARKRHGLQFREFM